MKKHTVRWSKLIFPLLVHSASKIRDKALIAMETGMTFMMKYQDEIRKILPADMKAVC